VAVPHARLENIERVVGVFVRLDTPVAYGSVDDRPVDLLFALFAPPKDGAEHLRALAAVSRALRSSEMREQLRQARTVDAIRALFVRDNAPATAA
jgi:PTS system nitrogen regulatory IIA component